VWDVHAGGERFGSAADGDVCVARSAGGRAGGREGAGVRAGAVLRPATRPPTASRKILRHSRRTLLAVAGAIGLSFTVRLRNQLMNWRASKGVILWTARLRHNSKNWSRYVISTSVNST
jgi:hypothetical protein